MYCKLHCVINRPECDLNTAGAIIRIYLHIPILLAKYNLNLTHKNKVIIYDIYQENTNNNIQVPT